MNTLLNDLSPENSKAFDVIFKDMTLKKHYLVMQIGCMECGVSSYPIKVCKTLDEAMTVATAHPSTWETEDGDGYVQIIDLDACKNVETAILNRR